MKKWYLSKTLWFNVVAVAVFIASAFGYADFIPDADVLAIVAAVLNLVLRLVTNDKLTR